MRSASTSIIILAACAAFAQADVIELSLDDAWAFGSFGSFGNFASVIDLGDELGAPLGTPVALYAVSWDLSIDTMGNSWLSEVTLHLDDADSVFPPSSAAMNLTPAIGSDSAGAGEFVGSLAVDAMLLSEGRLYLEFFDSFDDIIGGNDAMVSGTIALDVRVVPAPVSAMALLGGLSIGAARRRRRG